MRVCGGGEIKLRFCELCPVGIGLEVGVDGRPCLANVECKRRLSDLPGPNQRDGWHRLQSFCQLGHNLSLNDPGNCGV